LRVWQNGNVITGGLSAGDIGELLGLLVGIVLMGFQLVVSRKFEFREGFWEHSGTLGGGGGLCGLDDGLSVRARELVLMSLRGLVIIVRVGGVSSAIWLREVVRSHISWLVSVGVGGCCD